MEFAPTNNRNFYGGKFNDINGIECSLQESSAMRSEGCIWLGFKAADMSFKLRGGQFNRVTEKDILKILPEGAEFYAFSRMHLDQTEVSNLLPSLMYFTKHGYLPDEGYEKTKQEMDGYRESIHSLRQGV